MLGFFLAPLTSFITQSFVVNHSAHRHIPQDSIRDTTLAYMNAKCDLCENEATVHEVSLRAGVRIERHLCESCAAGAGITPPPSELPPILGLLQNLMLGQGDPDIQGLFPPVVGPPTPPTPPTSPPTSTQATPPPSAKTAGEKSKPTKAKSQTPNTPSDPTKPSASPSQTPEGTSPADPADLKPQIPKSPNLPLPPRHTTMSGKSHICNTCKLTFADFKQSGLLGCADCYRYFEAFLGPLIQRAQDGGITHVGKKPRRVQAVKAAESSSQPSPQATSQAASTTDSASPDQAALWLQAHKARLVELRGMLSHVIKTEQYEIAARIRDELARISLEIQRVETQGHTPWLQQPTPQLGQQPGFTDKPLTGDSPT